MRSAFVLLAAVGVAAACTFSTTHEARACGGCFTNPSQVQNGDVVTDERMIFRVTPQASTLYDEIEYSGNPQSFAWVLPIHGTVTVGLSSDIVFSAMDAVTVPTIISPTPPQCGSCSCATGAENAASGSGGGSSSGGGAPPVTVLSQQTVGPYATVQLQSSDPNALNDWLTSNGYAIPSNVAPVLAAYVSEGFDFLALKLSPGQGVAAMRPVRVTTPGAGLTLPLRMIAAGTGATVGLTLWIVADGRYAPQNFPTFTISGSDLVWDWSTQESNYTTVRAQKEAALNNAAWQIESALQLSPYQIESPILNDEASQDYLPVPGADDAGADDAGIGEGETADQVRQDDLATLFPGGDQSEVFVTRIRGDLSHAALANDLVVEASADQSILSNQYFVTQSINAPACPAVPNPCPPCAYGNGGSSSGGIFGDVGSGTSGTSGGSGCSTTPEDRGGANGGIILAGLVVAAIALNRGRRRAS